MIELMVIVAIIGVLAMIAIAQYSSYRSKAYNASAKSHMVFMITAEEAYFVEKQGYVAVPAGEGPGPTGTLPGTAAPAGVGFVVGAFPDSNLSNFVAFAAHRAGTKVYGGDSHGSKRWRKWKTATSINAAEDAKAENVTKLLSSTWGPTL